MAVPVNQAATVGAIVTIAGRMFDAEGCRYRLLLRPQEPRRSAATAPVRRVAAPRVRAA
jgi:hypothetical protein